MHDMKKDNSGFSLIELIIVIAIMVVLIGVLTPAIMGYIGKSQRTLDTNTAAEIKRAVDRILAMDSSTGNSYYDEEAGVWKSVVAVLWNEKKPVANQNIMYNKIIDELGYIPVSRYDEDLYWRISYTTELDYIFLVESATATEGYMLYPDPTTYINEGKMVEIPPFKNVN